MRLLFSAVVVITLASVSVHLKAQSIKQTIRGTVVDHDSQFPLIGATVVVVGTNPIVGTVTDVDGRFRIENVPVGRVTLRVTYMGYEERTIPNLLVTAAKEEVLRVALTESVNALETITIVAENPRGEALNEMALASAQTFSVEETQRYAGSFDDPARLVTGFAGVVGNPEGDNDIVVRGNTPRGILWRLEGVAIPNPNHFAGEGSTGGPINALSSKMLSNSDFFTGAFAPEYGDVTSGVFDMKLKQGNNERREYTAALSTLGIDVTAEGPIAGSRASYIFNYRYSALDLLDRAGVVDFGGIPRYQDLSFKVQVPVGDRHHLSWFGLWGKSGIDSEDTSEEDEDLIVGKFGGRFNVGVVGMNHIFQVSDDAYLRTTVSANTTGSTFLYAIPDENQSFYDVEDGEISKTNMIATSVYNHKISAKNKVEAGFIYTRMGFDMHVGEWDFERDAMFNVLSDDGYAGTLQAFASWKHRVNDDLTFVNGLHYLRFLLNGNQSVEPRSSLKWRLSEKHALSAGVGLHSKVDALSTYLAKQYDEVGGYEQPNRNLGIGKALHLVVGYDRQVAAHTRLKIEGYYQHLYEVPVENLPSSTFSLLNQLGGYTTRALVNEGKGRNYGLEMTAERHLHQGLYYMGTLSLFRSLYTAIDGEERASAFDNNYVVNLIGGKEFPVGKAAKNKVLFVNTRLAVIGGLRYMPVDLAASIDKGWAVVDESDPFKMKGDDIFRTDFSVGIRRNHKRVTTELKLDIQNIFNNQAVLGEGYVAATQSIYQRTQLGMLPNVSYKVSF